MTVIKVLVCDDSATDLTHIKNIVEGAGCLTVTASNGAEALERTKSEQPDVIFLDIIMPEMDGFRDLPQVAQRSRHQKHTCNIRNQQAAKSGSCMGAHARRQSVHFLHPRH